MNLKSKQYENNLIEKHKMLKMEKGKYVSRSAFQKLAEENKRLLADIYILVSDNIPDRIFVRSKWQRKIKENKLLAYELSKIAGEQSIKDHADYESKKDAIFMKGIKDEVKNLFP